MSRKKIIDDPVETKTDDGAVAEANGEQRPPETALQRAERMAKRPFYLVVGVGVVSGKTVVIQRLRSYRAGRKWIAGAEVILSESFADVQLLRAKAV